jgi:hypothetical protein
VTAAHATAARYDATTRGFEYLRVHSFETRTVLPATFNDSTETASTTRLQLAQAPVPNPGVRAPGLYVQVIDGLIHVANSAGTQSFAAGQFGYTGNSLQPPLVVPTNPGLKFTPPPVFSQSTGPSPTTGPAKSNSVDCEVR